MKISQLLNEMISPDMYLRRIANAFNQNFLKKIDTGSVKKDYQDVRSGEWVITYKGDGDLRSGQIMPEGGNTVGKWFISLNFTNEEAYRKYEPKLNSMMKAFEKDCASRAIKFDKITKKPSASGFLWVAVYKDDTSLIPD